VKNDSSEMIENLKKISGFVKNFLEKGVEI
jgi:hypothetical protein